MGSAEVEEEMEELPRGHLGAFVASLTLAQKKLWRPIRRLMKADHRAAGDQVPRSPRDQLHEAINEAQGTITAEKIEELIDNAVSSGDIQALRVLAQMAGIDLTRRPQQEVGPGAKVVLLYPQRSVRSEEAAPDPEPIGASEEVL